MGLIAICAAALAGLAAGDLVRLDAARLLTAAVAALTGAALGWRKPAWRLLALATCAAALGAARASTTAADSVTPAPAFVALDSASARSGQPADRPTDRPPYGSPDLPAHHPTAGPASTATDGPSDGSTAQPADPTMTGRTDQPNDPAMTGRADQPNDPAMIGRTDQPSDATTAGHTDQQSDPGLAGGIPRPPDPGLAGLIEGGSIAWPMASARAAIERGVRLYLPEPQASLALGVLLGGSGQLDAATRLDLQHSGLAHLVAIDGLKQVLVAAALGKLSARLIGPFFGAVPTLVGIAGYTLLTGGHPSAVRAGLMVGLATFGSLVGRVSDPLTSLLLAVVLMAAVQPRVLLDVGLQLSLSATLGIVLLWPRLRRRVRRLPRWMTEPVGLTLAVSLATLPLMVSTFQVVSLVSPLAHVVALPLLSAVLVTTALLAAVSPLAPLGAMLGWLAWLPTTLLLAVIRFFGGWPAAAVATGRPAPLAALCLAGALLAWGAWGLPEVQAAWLALVRRRMSGREPGAPPVSAWRSLARVGRWRVPAAGLGALLAAPSVLALVQPDGRLHVDRLALARGEAVFIRGPTGRTVLLVRGPAEAPSLVREVAGHLALWEHKLDAAVQLDASSARALAFTLSRYPADRRLVFRAHEPRLNADGSQGNGPQINPRGTGEEDGAEVDLGGGLVLDVSQPDGQVLVRYPRPGSADTELTTLSALSALRPRSQANLSQALYEGRLQPVPKAACRPKLQGWARSGPTTSAARPGSAD